MTKDSDLKIKRFKDGSSSWWVGNLHYTLNELNEICFVAGGIDTENHREILRKYINRTKSTFIPRQPTMFETEDKEYTKIGFGKYSQMTTTELVATDKKYSSWLYKNCSDNKIKTELKELLKIK